MGLFDTITNTVVSGIASLVGPPGDGGLGAGNGEGGLGSEFNSGNDDSGYGLGYGYGYGYGGGGGGASAADQQAKTQAQIDNTGANYSKRGGDITKNTETRLGDFNNSIKQRMNDMSDIGGKQLDTIQQQINANRDAYIKNVRNANQQVEWQPNEQKKQSTLMAQRNRLGNGILGSAAQDLLEGMMRVDDMADVGIINAWKQNMNSLFNNMFQADTALTADWGDKVADILDQFSSFKADYNNEISEMKTSYNDTMSDLFSQYWATVSNINPELASEANINKAKTESGVSVGSDTDKYTLSKVNLDPSIDFDSAKLDIKPSDTLAKRLVLKEIMDAQNPLTKNYIRPDKAMTKRGGANGEMNLVGAANTGFSDNLAPFRRV